MIRPWAEIVILPIIQGGNFIIRIAEPMILVLLLYLAEDGVQKAFTIVWSSMVFGGRMKKKYDTGSDAQYRYINFDQSRVYGYLKIDKNIGLSVRCLKNS